MSYTQLCYHIIFGTKFSEPTINTTYKKELYAYIWGIVKKHNGTLMRIGGIENHVHMFCSIPPKFSIAEFVKAVKGSSSAWLQNTPENKEKFPNFQGWAEGYCALTYAFNDRDTIINYIANQEEHHKHESWREEFIRFLKKYHIQYDERYLPPLGR